jgi:D-glycero-D-manno-heptose 1,7-bisphosphate phosphatase
MGRAGVFVDRDGTLNEEVGYLDHPDRCVLLPRSADAVRILNEAGLVTILISNQSGVARGYFPERRVGEVHGRLAALLAAEGARFDAIYYCPHHPDFGPPGLRGPCACRKPGTGMIERGVSEFGLDPARSYVVGDKLSDVACAKAAGATGILVLTGHGREELARGDGSGGAAPDHQAADLHDAAAWIVARERARGAEG